MIKKAYCKSNVFIHIFTGRTASNKVLHDKAFNIAKNPKYNEYERRLASLVYNCFDENSSATHKGQEINSENQQLDK